MYNELIKCPHCKNEYVSEISYTDTEKTCKYCNEMFIVHYDDITIDGEDYPLLTYTML